MHNLESFLCSFFSAVSPSCLLLRDLLLAELRVVILPPSADFHFKTTKYNDTVYKLSLSRAHVFSCLPQETRTNLRPAAFSLQMSLATRRRRRSNQRYYQAVRQAIRPQLLTRSCSLFCRSELLLSSNLSPLVACKRLEFKE
jgi:hypothetical protein